LILLYINEEIITSVANNYSFYAKILNLERILAFMGKNA